VRTPVFAKYSVAAHSHGQMSICFDDVKSLLQAAIRSVRGFSRPSKATNMRRLSRRGETLAAFTIRYARPQDVPALARLHVRTFVETHGGPGPSCELRERQWRETFAKPGGNWFCYVIVRQDADLVGFAKGVPYEGELPGFAGELNKLYILREYQRLGLGRRLIGYVARAFLLRGVDSMLLFGEATNPSNGFYEAFGAERLLTPSGDFHGGYGWRDLRRLVELCAADDC
jgi:ribosomal protein S18 acetylase RimI-like enzyme